MEREQILALAGEPLYQVCKSDSVSLSAAWIDVDAQTYQDAGLYAEYGRRVLYTADQVLAARKDLEQEVERLKVERDNHQLDINAELRQQLAAAQAREQQLRKLLEHAPVSSGVCCCGDSMDSHPDPMVCGHSPVDQWDWAVWSLLKETQDTTALEAIAEKAGEVMREKAAKVAYNCWAMNKDQKYTDEAIRALSGVTMEDLK